MTAEQKYVTVAGCREDFIVLDVELLPGLIVPWSFSGNMHASANGLHVSATSLAEGYFKPPNNNGGDFWWSETEPRSETGPRSKTGSSIGIEYRPAESTRVPPMSCYTTGYKLSVPADRLAAILTEAEAVVRLRCPAAPEAPPGELVFAPRSPNDITVRISREAEEGLMLHFERDRRSETFIFSVAHPEDISVAQWLQLAYGDQFHQDINKGDGLGYIDSIDGEVLFAMGGLGGKAESTNGFPLSSIAPQLIRAIDAAIAAGLFRE